jgi:hypothetical protein
MGLKIYKVIIVGCVILLMSCEKKELPVPKRDRGTIITQQIELAANYKNQVWFSLSENKIVRTTSKIDWDLAFDCDVSSQTIYINTSKVMRAYKTSKVNLSEIMDTTGYNLSPIADMPSGNRDSTALNNWHLNTNVYVISRGYDENSQLMGLVKLKIISSSSSNFTIQYAPLNSSTYTQATIQKNSAYNRMMFSFDSGQATTIEPKKGEFDLCFTQYTDFFADPDQYYQVTGVLNNTYRTRIALINTKLFNDISIGDTASVAFSTLQNGIGYDWKTFSLTTNLFTVDAKKCYLIHDSKGFYYKLHFIDFYNENGIKGYPKFEYKKL